MVESLDFRTDGVLYKDDIRISSFAISCNVFLHAEIPHKPQHNHYLSQHFQLIRIKSGVVFQRLETVIRHTIVRYAYIHGFAHINIS